MASVQELLAAANAEKSPFQSLVEGLGQGFQQGYGGSLDRTKQLLEIDQMRQAAIRQAENDNLLRQQLAGKTEDQTQNDLNGVSATGKPPTPGLRLASVTTGPGGYLKPEFKVIEPKPFETANAEQAMAIQSGDPVQLSKAFGGTVPKWAMEQADSAAKTVESRKTREQQLNEQRFTAFSQDLDPNKRGSGEYGIAQGKVNQAERLETLSNAFLNGNLPSSQMEELGVGLSKLISGSGQGSEGTINKLVPKTALGDVRQFQSWLFGDPVGADQQAFVKMMMGTVQREKATAQDQLNRTAMQKIAGHSNLEQADPQRFNDVMQSWGVDPQAYKAWKKGGFKPISAVQAPEAAAPAADAWTPDKESRYQELLKKKQAGSLK